MPTIKSNIPSFNLSDFASFRVIDTLQSQPEQNTNACSRKLFHTKFPTRITEFLTPNLINPYFKYISCILYPTFHLLHCFYPKAFLNCLLIFTHPIVTFNSSLWKERITLSSHGIQETREGITELYMQDRKRSPRTGCYGLNKIWSGAADLERHCIQLFSSASHSYRNANCALALASVVALFFTFRCKICALIEFTKFGKTFLIDRVLAAR